MIRNYIITAFRNIRKNTLYSIINVLGLGFGIAAFLVIFQYVSHEYSYDRFHEKSDRIYRLNLGRLDEGYGRGAKSAGVMAPILKDNYAGIEAYARLRKFPSLVSFKETRIHEDGFYFTDSTFFKVFSFDLIEGNPDNVLREPNTIILTESAAKRILGRSDQIVGEVINVDNQLDFRIDGVVKDSPTNSHFDFDYLASIASIPNHYNVPLKTYQTFEWYAHYYYTFLLLEDGVDAELLGESLEEASKTLSPPEYYELYGTNMGLYLQSLEDIHLNPRYGEIGPQGDSGSLYILSTAGLFILLLAIINYANLATAQSIRRIKEVALRKTLGAKRKELILQFLGESFVITLIGFALALSMIQLFQNDLITILGLQPGVFKAIYGPLFPYLILILVVVSFLGGAYPSIYLSAFGVDSLFRNRLTGKRKFGFRKAVIFIQFTVSMMLISCTVVVFSQLQFMKSQELGIDTEQILIIPTYGNSDIHGRYDLFRNQLSRLSEVKFSTLSELSPGDNAFGVIGRFEGTDSNQSFTTTGIDHDYVKTYGLQLLAGRDFSRAIATDTVERVIINRKLSTELGWSPEEAIGKSYDFGGDGITPGMVIGVIEDFHLNSLKQSIRPFVLTIFPDFYQKIAIKVETGDFSQAISNVEDTWRSVYPEWPFDYSLVDEDFEKQYAADQRFGDLFVIFTFLGLFIGALGIYGLIQLMIQYRMKELSIRKVLGAQIWRLVRLLSAEYLLLLVLSFVVCAPLVYYYMSEWLSDFEYRISVDWWMVAISLVIVLMICFGTIGNRIYRSAVSSPVDSLRQE